MRFHTNDITAVMVEQAQAAVPEGVSVLVLTDDESVARQVAPMLAMRLYPDMTFGEVLHIEQVDDAHEVVLRRT